MIPDSIEAAIFDFDGVIADTEQMGIDIAVELLRERHSIELTGDDKKAFYGLQDLEFYRRIAQKYRIPERPEALLSEHNTRYDQAIMGISESLPGVGKTLETMRKKGLKAAICSGSYLHQISIVLSNIGLTGSFDVIVSCEQTSAYKPDPEPYLLAAKKLGVLPGKCLVFEDSWNGVLSAKAAGMYCIGVCIGNHNTQDLGKADQVVFSLECLRI